MKFKNQLNEFDVIGNTEHIRRMYDAAKQDVLAATEQATKEGRTITLPDFENKLVPNYLKLQTTNEFNASEINKLLDMASPDENWLKQVEITLQQVGGIKDLFLTTTSGKLFDTLLSQQIYLTMAMNTVEVGVHELWAIVQAHNASCLHACKHFDAHTSDIYLLAKLRVHRSVCMELKYSGVEGRRVRGKVKERC